MESKVAKAEELFKKGYNCAQAVLMTHANLLKIDRHFAAQVAAGFGGGMGSMQKTCGAITGAYMVLGIYARTHTTDNRQLKELGGKLVRDFTQRFVEIHQNTDCRNLLDVDLQTIEGKKEYTENNLKERVCLNCVRNSVVILEDILDKGLY